MWSYLAKSALAKIWSYQAKLTLAKIQSNPIKSISPEILLSRPQPKFGHVVPDRNSFESHPSSSHAEILPCWPQQKICQILQCQAYQKSNSYPFWIQICVHRADTKEFDRFGRIHPNFVQDQLGQISIGTNLTEFGLIRPNFVQGHANLIKYD